jgi:hypothetical protein
VRFVTVSLVLFVSALLFSIPAVRASESLARELTHLNSLKEGLRRETENLRRSDKLKFDAIQREVEKYEQRRSRLATEIDREEAELQALQQRMKVLGTTSAIDSATRELKKELSRFTENRSEAKVDRAGPTSERRSADTALSRFLESVDEARLVLKRSSEVRDEARGFYLVDGETVQGRVTWVGETAAVGLTNGQMAPLSPDGNGGWRAIRPLQSSQSLQPENNTISHFVVFSSLKDRIDGGVSATLGDRALGLVPLVWLSLLGVAVAWLFALIAKN